MSEAKKGILSLVSGMKIMRDECGKRFMMQSRESFHNEDVRIRIQSRQILFATEDACSQNDKIENGQIENNKTETHHMETVIFGRHYYRGGKHYLLYEELLEGVDKPTACRMKISSDAMEMTRQGEVRTVLIFEEGQSNKSNYHTPYGVISLETETTRFHVCETEDSLEVEAEYILAMDGQPVSENKLHVGVYHA